MADEKIFKFNLGDEVRDKITGLEGVITVRSHWYNGCITYGVQPKELKDGAPLERQSFDEPQLELVEDTAAPPTGPKQPGGPARKHPAPSRMV